MAGFSFGSGYLVVHADDRPADARRYAGGMHVASARCAPAPKTIAGVIACVSRRRCRIPRCRSHTLAGVTSTSVEKSV